MKFLALIAAIIVSWRAAAAFVSLIALAAELAEAKRAPYFFATCIAAILALAVKYILRP